MSDRYDSFVALLRQPDPSDLIGRGSRDTCARDPRRDPDVIKRDLGIAYVEHRRQERQFDGDISCIVSLRRRPLLLMKRA